MDQEVPQEELKPHELITFLLKLREKGVSDARLLSTIERTDRRVYVPDIPADELWQDRAFSIGYGQNSSILSIMALMIHSLGLTGRDKVLEIGTGSGYQTAILARMSRRVYSVERIRALTHQAERNLITDEVRNVTLFTADGYKGWPSQAPFDAIIVNGACGDIPTDLVLQLKDQGRMVIPLDEGPGEEAIVVVCKSENGLIHNQIGYAEFPPLIAGRTTDQ